MTRRFEWLAVETWYRDVRTSPRGDELRLLVNRETIRDAATGEVRTRSIFRHPGICVMVPFVAEDRILLVRQYRHSIDAELWELPAGTISCREETGRVIPTETPVACAARELLEETGYEATELTKVAECHAMPGGSDELVHVFVARGLIRRQQALDVGEVIEEVRAFSSAELESMIARGEIHDAKTLVGLLHALGRRPGGVRIG